MLINITVGLGTMIATGGNAIVSRKMGAGENQEAKEDFTLLILNRCGDWTSYSFGRDNLD